MKKTEKTSSDAQLLERTIDFAGNLQEEVYKLREALIWCSGSEDFQEGGKAREGWLKLCAPLLEGK